MQTVQYCNAQALKNLPFLSEIKINLLTSKSQSEFYATRTISLAL